MNLIGRTIANRYEILEKTGVGGMATVYTAKDLVLNRHVAVKVLKEEFTTDEEFVKRFNTEALAAASLSHANIVSIYDVGNEDNIYYIVMELVRGKTLKQIITENGPISWKWATNIAIQIASALEVAHKNNIVHRDIKPHNIIITEDGVAKVTDFGIAKAVSNSTITAFGTTIGSVHYFSPEQAKGGYTDAKSDIYSLGVVMYEMLTGQVPFDADTSVSVALMHMQEKPVPPIEINKNIPTALNDIILKAMQKEPMARYQTAAEMISDLRRALKEPNGEFVEEEMNDGLTRRMDAITDDMLDKKGDNKKKKGKLALYFEKHPKMKGVAIVLLCVVLFVLAFGGTALVSKITTPKEVQIPNLVGKTEEEAKEELAKINVKYNKINEKYSSEVEAGKIISQEPGYSINFKIKEKSTVNVIISKGTETTTVPKVIGMKYDDAVAALEAAKLTVEKVEEASKTVEAGIVISQEIAANTTANAGDVVKIHVSTGITQVEVPSVLGKTEVEAKQILADKKFKVEIKTTSDTSKENGVVVEQSVNAGKEIDEESTITITVNKFEETKEAKLRINVKSLTGGYSESTNSTDVVKTKKLTVKVGEDKVWEENVDLNTTNKEITVSGKGTITVRVYLNDVLQKRQFDINLNTTSNYTFE
ncbi:MAG: Stk1 family PASTA domain-containing Ser/Thr kinase [Clostridia bacterium]